jgi:hypothetical protein
VEKICRSIRAWRNDAAIVAAICRAQTTEKPTTTNKKQPMKKIIIPVLALFTFGAFAEDRVEKTTTTTTTTTTRGTITEYAPGKTFIIKEESGPVTYRYGKEVVYVTKGGKTLTEDQVRTRIKVGIPVSVHYIKDGEHRVIRRVEVDDE